MKIVQGWINEKSKHFYFITRANVEDCVLQVELPAATLHRQKKLKLYHLR